MKDEPLWRTVLNWGCVGYFLGIPLIVLFIGFFHIELFDPGSAAPKFLGNFHLSVSALVAAMAGLNSFDKYKADGNGSQRNQVPMAPPDRKGGQGDPRGQNIQAS